MSIQAHPTATTGTSIALALAAMRAPIAESFGADLRKGTWTFKISPETPVAAGKYGLVALDQLLAAIERDSEALAGSIRLRKPGQTRTSFYPVNNRQVINIADEAGFECNLYRQLTPDEDRPDREFHPAIWYGSIKHTDDRGDDWRRSAHFVQDDFGDLVEVPN